ncbi:MAG: carbohydrate ABC transporter permease, partial [Lachnospiraceae bacterium]|nr:carbohydrate ABC transporter permease [Lachnospiraceae bacterium]
MKRCGKGMEALMLLFALVMIVPVCILAAGSFMGEDELTLKLGAILGTGDSYAELTLTPIYPTLKAYVEVLLDTPEFFVMFWNSVKITAGSLATQLIFGTLAAWGFAKWEFPLKKALLWLYIVLMLMPFQVLMLSDYLVLQRLNLLDSHLGLILLCGFSTFPVFIMYRFFCGIPDEVMEAARLDGAGDIKLFFYIGLPLGKSGIWSTTSSGGGIVDDTEGTGIFYASKSGLYHYKWGGGVAEKLFEGSATKLGDSDYTVWSVAALSDSCVLCHYLTASGDSLLVRYSFSGNSPTTQKLTLYTLYENELLTDEVNTFNQNHTDIQVTIEVGLSGDSGLT